MLLSIATGSSQHSRGQDRLRRQRRSGGAVSRRARAPFLQKRKASKTLPSDQTKRSAASLLESAKPVVGVLEEESLSRLRWLKHFLLCRSSLSPKNSHQASLRRVQRRLRVFRVEAFAQRLCLRGICNNNPTKALAIHASDEQTDRASRG